MNFSIKSLLIALLWVALLFAAVSGAGRPVTILFIAAQYLLLSTSVVLALFSVGTSRVLGASFAAGFLGWLLLLGAEGHFADMKAFRHTVPGSLIADASVWIGNLVTFEERDAQFTHYGQVAAVIRSACATVLGILNCILVLRFARGPCAWNEQASESEAPPS